MSPDITRLELIKRLTPYWQIGERGCWLWTGDKTDKGYGRIAIGGKSQRVHRVVYSVFIEPIQSGCLVCHMCDVRHCFNPTHLFIGTHQDNMSDMKAKGRVRVKHGEDSPNAKLTASIVKEIRFRHAMGEHLQSLAAEYGVSRSAVGLAVLRKTWASVE